MKIKMTQSICGSLDGVTVISLIEGEEYDTVDSARGERLALAHIRKGIAVAVDVSAPAAAPDSAPAAPSPSAKTPRTKK